MGWGEFSGSSDVFAVPAVGAGGAASTASVVSAAALSVESAARGELGFKNTSRDAAAPRIVPRVEHLAASPAIGDAGTTTLSLRWQPPPSTAGKLQGYALKVREIGADVWQYLGTVSGSGSRTAGPGAAGVDEVQGLNEVQTVATHPQESGKITGGSFRLTLPAHGRNAARATDYAVTEHIPWDATASQMQTALQKLGNVVAVQVRRTGPTRRNNVEVVSAALRELAWFVTQKLLAVFAAQVFPLVSVLTSLSCCPIPHTLSDLSCTIYREATFGR